MIITAKTFKKLIAIISLTVSVFSSSILWAQNTAFSDYFLSELKVIEVSLEAETVLLESPNGDIAVLSIGDLVGDGEYEITEIQRFKIVLESPPDNSGLTVKKFIPVIRIEPSLPLNAQ